jgi:hypothetical protein
MLKMPANEINGQQREIRGLLSFWSRVANGLFVSDNSFYPIPGYNV